MWSRSARGSAARDETRKHRARMCQTACQTSCLPEPHRSIGIGRMPPKPSAVYRALRAANHAPRILSAPESGFVYQLPTLMSRYDADHLFDFFCSSFDGCASYSPWMLCCPHAVAVILPNGRCFATRVRRANRNRCFWTSAASHSLLWRRPRVRCPWVGTIAVHCTAVSNLLVLATPLLAGPTESVPISF